MSTSNVQNEIIEFMDDENDIQCSFSFLSYGDCPESIQRRHLDLLLHGDYASSKAIYPQPDLIDLRELFSNQAISVDAAAFSVSGIAAAMKQWIPKIKQQHSIEGKCALVVDGDLGMSELCEIIEQLEQCSIDPLPVAYWDDGVHDQANVSLWWVERANSEEDWQKAGGELR